MRFKYKYNLILCMVVFICVICYYIFKYYELTSTKQLNINKDNSSVEQKTEESNSVSCNITSKNNDFEQRNKANKAINKRSLDSEVIKINESHSRDILPNIADTIPELDPFNSFQDFFVFKPNLFTNIDFKNDNPNLDPNIRTIFNKYNNLQKKISTIVFEAESEWVGYSNEIWPLKFDLDRNKKIASVQSFNEFRKIEEKCEIKENMMFSYDWERGAIEINALHLLMFKQYDPREFDILENGELLRENSEGQELRIPVAIVKKGKEELYFDAQSGHLLRASLLSEKGIINIDLSEYKYIKNSKEIMVPTVSKIKLSDEYFPFSLRPEFTRIIKLTIDPTKVEVTK